MTPRSTYTLIAARQTIASAITILQIKAGAQPIELIRAWVSQRSSATAAQEQVSLIRKSAAATVTAAVLGTTLLKHDPAQGASSVSLGTAATGLIATAEGTDSDEILPDGFNTLNGWLWVPTQQSRIVVGASGIIALKFMVAPASQVWLAGMTFTEEVSS